MLRRAALLALVATAALAAPAAAAPTWLAPETIGVGRTDDPQVAVSGQGDVLAVYEQRDTGGYGVAFRPAGGTFAAEPQLMPGSPTFAPVSLALAPNGEAVALFEAQGGGGGTTRVAAAARPPGGPFGAPTFTDVNRREPQVAFDGASNAIAVWARVSPHVVEAAFRPPGGSFGTAVPIAPLSASGVAEPHLAVNAAGDAATTWRDSDGPSVVRVSIRPAGGSFGPGVIVSPTNAGDQHVGIDGAGNVVVLWRASSGRAQVAFRPAGGTFSSPVDISPPGDNVQFLDLAVEPSGRATAIWENITAGRVEVADRPSGGAFGPVQMLDDHPASGIGVATNARGDAIAIWVPTSGRTAASNRPAGGAFGPAQTLSPEGENDQLPDVAVDTAGNAAAVWRDVAPASSFPTRAAGFDATAPELRSLAFPGGGAALAPLAFSVAPFDVWSPVSVAWDFGDGTSADGASVSHAYGAGGTFGARVTATDAVGNAASASASVPVTAAPTGGGTTTTTTTTPVLTGNAPPSSGRATAALLGRTLRFRGGKATEQARCDNVAGDQCTLALTARTGAAPAARRRPKPKTLARARATIAGGRTAKVTWKLTAAGRTALRRKRVAAALAGTSRNRAGETVRLTGRRTLVKAPAKKRRKR